MKICITSEGKTLESNVDPRFGRCQNFIFFDDEKGDFEAVENCNLGSQGGAGIQAGQVVASQGCKVILTGNVGPNAYKVLQAAGVKMFTGVTGTVKEAIEGYKNGKYKETDAPSVVSKFGMPGKNK